METEILGGRRKETVREIENTAVELSDSRCDKRISHGEKISVRCLTVRWRENKFAFMADQHIKIKMGPKGRIIVGSWFIAGN